MRLVLRKTGGVVLNNYNGKFANDFAVSNERLDLLIAHLNKTRGAGLTRVEGRKDEVARMLDMKSGIDALLTGSLGCVSGVAVRIQDGKNWETFTIRHSRSTGARTEYIKRKEAIANSRRVFYPHYTMQVYMIGANLMGGAYCLTESLFCAAYKYEPFESRDGGKPVYLNRNGSDFNTFIVVPFSEIAKEKISVIQPVAGFSAKRGLGK